MKDKKVWADKEKYLKEVDEMKEKVRKETQEEMMGKINEWADKIEKEEEGSGFEEYYDLRIGELIESINSRKDEEGCGKYTEEIHCGKKIRTGIVGEFEINICSKCVKKQGKVKR